MSCSACHMGHRLSFGTYFMSEMRVLLMAVEEGPDVLFCMPYRTKCILLFTDALWGRRTGT
jgi:hypothetical protein